MTNKFSVVGFVKDEANYFLKAMLYSIVGYADEVIMVDNGSSDHTVAVIKEFPSVKLLEIETTPDELPRAINAGIQQASCDWIMIMGGDEAALPAEMLKIRPMIDEMLALGKRIGMTQYYDFIGDFRHYHTKYDCWVTRLWRNECNFSFKGGWQGEIYMGYDDGVHTGGITVKKNIPEEQVHRRADIKFCHYARCKPKELLKKKRKRYWQLRVAPELVKEKLKADPFYTLDFGEKIAIYEGEIPRYVEKKS